MRGRFHPNHPLIPLLFILLSAWFSLPNATAQSTSPLPSQALLPTEHALSGGIVALITPGSHEILIPRSTFTMGSTPEEVRFALETCQQAPLGPLCNEEMFDHERNTHRVTLSPYWLDRKEVTVREYQHCIAQKTCPPPPYSKGANRFNQPDYPVTLVSWDDARAYCAFQRKRLPTEAEWERAARGLGARRFPWGNHIAPSRANHGSWALDNTDDSDGFSELAPVGSFPQGRTPEGFEDLAGNVAEWVMDTYEDGYEAKPVTNPKGPAFGTEKVIRGGAYTTGMPWLRGAARMFRKASTKTTYLGFRCARDATSSP